MTTMNPKILEKVNDLISSIEVDLDRLKKDANKNKELTNEATDLINSLERDFRYLSIYVFKLPYKKRRTKKINK